MKQESKVLNGVGVLVALCLAEESKMNVEYIINLLNKVAEEG